MNHDERQAEIDAVCHGWSHALHWKYFAKILLGDPRIKRVLVLGVYMGRDCAYMKSIRPDVHIVGVDKFNGLACADWPADKRLLSWQEAGYGEPPSWQKARANLDRLGCKDVELRTQDAKEFLQETRDTVERIRLNDMSPIFTHWADFIYIDTSHDYETTRDTIKLALPLAPLLGGDDYSDAGTWGVKRAVTEAFAEHEVFGDYIWTAKSSDFKV